MQVGNVHNTTSYVGNIYPRPNFVTYFLGLAFYNCFSSVADSAKAMRLVTGFRFSNVFSWMLVKKKLKKIYCAK